MKDQDSSALSSSLVPAEKVSFEEEMEKVIETRQRNSTEATPEEIKGAPPKRTRWVTTGFLVISDIVGVGVMSLTSVRFLFVVSANKLTYS